MTPDLMRQHRDSELARVDSGHDVDVRHLALVKVRDRPAALSLTAAAGGLALDAIIHPLLQPTQLPHPWVQGFGIAIMIATAIGVRLGKRPARWLARIFGYAIGIGAFLAYYKFATLFGGVADWWVAAVWALETVLAGFMLHRLGWGGDED